MKHKAFFPVLAGVVACLGLATTQLRAEPGVEEIPVPGETVGSEEGVILPDGNDGGVITVEGGGEVTVGGDEGGGTVVDSDGGGEVTITPTEEGGDTTVTTDGGDGTVVANDDTTGTTGTPEGTTDDPGIYSPLAENNSPTSQAVNSIQSNAATDANNWDAATIHSAKEADGYSVEDHSKQTDLKATRQDGRVFLKTQP